MISDDAPPFVIAEIGQNHNGDVETCKEMFRAAKEAGADAVKLQKRNNKKLYTKAFYDSVYNSENAYAPTYGAHREVLEFGKREYRELKRYADKLGLIFFATAWDEDSADFLEELDMPAYKIASGDLTSTPLLEYIAKKKRPIIMSTGAATMEDVLRAYKTVERHNKNFAVLQCTATYPATPEELDLRVIETYRKQFPKTTIGLSDHYNGIALEVAAYALGARIFEKHFTLNRAQKGTDHPFSLEPTGLRKLVRDLHRARTAMGEGKKRVHISEEAPKKKMGKKLVFASNLPKGHVLKKEDIICKSPGDGVPPYRLEEFIGKTLKVEAKKESDLDPKDVSATKKRATKKKVTKAKAKKKK